MQLGALERQREQLGGTVAAAVIAAAHQCPPHRLPRLQLVLQGQLQPQLPLPLQLQLQLQWLRSPDDACLGSLP